VRKEQRKFNAEKANPDLIKKRGSQKRFRKILLMRKNAKARRKWETE
jgi:hypothetical protein